MTALAEYLLKANLCLAGFYALYFGLLRRHTFFSLNRAYLLTALAASFVLPLIPLPEPVVQTVSLPVIIDLPATVITAAPTGPTLEDVLLVIYGAGALLFLSLLAVSLWRLMQLIRSGAATRQADYTLVLLPDERVAPFSFFRYLVLNQADFDQHADPIVGHELAHIRQWHSVDVLLAELIKVICWPNPVAWLYKRSLQQVHEYLADQQATDKAQYARFLFDYAFQAEPNPVANSFFTPAMLTQRIRMLYQSRNTGRVLWKYALVLPLLTVLVGLTAARERIAETLMEQPGKMVTVSGRVVDGGGKPIPKATVLIVGGRHGTPTDEQGRFTLANVPATAKLAVSSVGYEVQLLPVRRGSLVARLKRTREELPKMGATAAYRAIGINKAMPVTADPPDSQVVNGEVYTVVEQNAIFPDGIPGLMYYVAHTLRYPAEAQKANVQGTVFVKFVVTATGSVNGVRVVKGLGKGCNQEAVRVVSQMPRWKPARQYGKPVPVEYVLPVQFALEQPDKRTGYIKVNGAAANNPANALQPVSAPQRIPKADGGPAVIIIKKPGEDGPVVFVDGEEKDKDFDVSTIKAADVDLVHGNFDIYKSNPKYKYGIIEITTKAKKP